MAATISTFEMGAMTGAAPKTLRLTSQAVYSRPRRDARSSGTTTSTYDASIGAMDHAHARDLCVQSRHAVKLGDMVSSAATNLPLERIYGAPLDDAATPGHLGEGTGSEFLNNAPRATAGFYPLNSGLYAHGGSSQYRCPILCFPRAMPVPHFVFPRADDAGAGADASSLRRPMDSAAPLADALPLSQRTVKEPVRTGVMGPFAMESEAQEAAFAAMCDPSKQEPRRGIQAAMVQGFFGAGSQDGPFPGARSARGEWMAATYYAHARPFGGAFAVHRPSSFSESGGKLHNFNRIG